ncbi:hypothetical protein AB5J62_42870 [Amycolatopsis sp. cg5]|uniref:hypothetical protein n=1 Tax=Amycolatopsis sp. cg5 TaxID=3238802 RepID=UPI003525721E
MGDAPDPMTRNPNDRRVITMPAPTGNTPMPGGGTPGGGGFQFDADKIDAVIQQWQDLLADLKADERDAEMMANVEAPGREFASGDWEKLANPSGKAFYAQNRAMQEYVEQYLESLQLAKKQITTQEAETEAAISKTGNRAQ